MITDPANVNPAGQASVDLLQNVTATNRGQPLTVVRMIGKVHIWPGDASNISEGVFGFIDVEADAELASAIPDPATDTAAKWMHWDRFLLGTQATGELSMGESTVFALDIKAQRRLRASGDTVDFIIDNDDGTHTFLFALGLRILLRR